MSQSEEPLQELSEIAKEVEGGTPTDGEAESTPADDVQEPQEQPKEPQESPKEQPDEAEDSIFQEMRLVTEGPDPEPEDTPMPDAPPPKQDEPIIEEKKEETTPSEDSNPQINVEDVKSAYSTLSNYVCSNEIATFHISGAQDEMNEVDVVVCGGCHSVFHFAEDLIGHKPLCKKQSNFRSSALELKPQVWAFLLWKNAQGKVNRHGIAIEKSSWKLYQKWCKMPERIRSAWVAAGETVMTYTTFGTQPKEPSPPLPNKVITKKVEKELSLPTSEEEERPVVMRRLVQRDHTGEIKEIRPTDAPPIATPTPPAPAPPPKPKTLIDDIESIRNQLEGKDPPETPVKKVDMQNGDTLREEEFVVEKIVSRRFNQKKKQYEYLLKWEGYPPEQNTWEPAENLETCEHLLRSFEESLAKQAAAARNRAKMRESASTSGRPVRHSKAKALTQVRQWCGSIRPDDVEVDMVKRKMGTMDSDEDDFLSKRIKMDVESDEESQPMAKILFTKQGGQSGIVKRVGRVGRPPKNPRPTNGETALSPVIDADEPIPDRLPISLLNRKPTVSNLSPVNQQVLVANAKGVLKVDPSQVPNLTSGVYIMSGKSIVKLDSVTPSKVVQLKQNQAVNQTTPQPSTPPARPTGTTVVQSTSGGQVVMIKNSGVPNAPATPRSGIVRRNPGILKPPLLRQPKPAQTQVRTPTTPTPRIQSGIIPRAAMGAASSGVKPKINVVKPPPIPPMKKIIDHPRKSLNTAWAGGSLKSGIHKKTIISKDGESKPGKSETDIFEDLPTSESSESEVQDDFPKDLPAVVPDSPPRPLTLCPHTGKVLGRAEGEPSPPNSPQPTGHSQMHATPTTVQSAQQQVHANVTQPSQVTRTSPGSTTIQIGGKSNKQLDELIKSESGGFITLAEAMPSSSPSTTKALFVNTSSGVATSEVVHSGIVKKLSPDSCRPSDTILQEDSDDMVTITADDGIVYKVSNTDLGRLLDEGGDGEQCVYVTEGGDDGVLQLSTNFSQSLTQVVNSEGETEYLMKEVAGEEGVVLGTGPEPEESSGQVVAQLVEAGEILPGGLRRVVLLLPDGNLMVTEVDEEQFAALELDK